MISAKHNSVDCLLRFLSLLDVSDVYFEVGKSDIIKYMNRVKYDPVSERI
jgi:hypothetical protein